MGIGCHRPSGGFGVDGGLVDELLGWVAGTLPFDDPLEEGLAVGADEGDGWTGQHVGLQAFGQPDGLPDAQDFFVDRDRSGPAVYVGIPFDHKDIEA